MLPAGTKLILPIIQRLAVELPPVATLVLHSAMVALAGSPSRYCATPVSAAFAWTRPDA